MFYTLLAMRQVFTVPQTQHITRSFFLMGAPKLLTWLPLSIYGAVATNDFRTAWIGQALQDGRYRILVMAEGAFYLSTTLAF